MKIGFFGGTFNPPHKGHERIINYCSKLFDELLVFPNMISPNKLNYPPVDSKHRINMLKLIIENDNVKVDTYEIVSELSSYTYYTVKYLLDKYQKCNLFMIIGKDQFLNLDNWYNIDFILKNTRILCFNRTISYDNKDILTSYPNVKTVDFNFSSSSSSIRAKIYKNEQIDNSLISNKVKDYIYEHNLYT